MRVVGSGLSIAAYFITLHQDVVTGAAIHVTAMMISVPYSIALTYDVGRTLWKDEKNRSDLMNRSRFQQ